MVMKIGKLVTYGEVNTPMKSADHKILQCGDVWWGETHEEITSLWSCDQKRSQLLFYKVYTTRLDRIVKYRDRKPWTHP